MWSYLSWAGIEESEIGWFEENHCPPDLLGLNHYLTSERFLDHRVELYPPGVQGRNWRQAYADVEAVRVDTIRRRGLRRLLHDAWERYRLPVAVTEAHLGCTREDQFRWLFEVWDAARGAHGEGVDVRAVTAWSVLGAYDWNSVMTRHEGHYEPGAWDVRAPQPRATALAVPDPAGELPELAGPAR